MKYKYSIPVFILIGGVLALSSCKKDFLDVTATDRIPTNTLESDTAVFEAFVTNEYIGTKLQDKEADGTNPGFGRGFEYSMWSSLTDESIYNNDDATWIIQRGQLAPESLGALGVIWGRSYRSIRECNYALTVLAKIQMSAAHKTMLEGEIKFIRAFRYQDLIRNYGKVVLMGDKVMGLKDDLQDPALFKRATIKEGIDYVVAQLDDAASKLPQDNSGSWVGGRATKGAALALKSRLTLYAASPLYAAGTWEAAVTAAQQVISLNKYSIYQGGYGNMFLINQSTESIFERVYTKNANHVHLEIANGPNGYGGWAGNTPTQTMVEAYDLTNGLPANATNPLYDPAKPYENRDPRFKATILYNGAAYRERNIETFIPGGKDSRDGNDNWNTTKTGYYLKKFMNDAYPLQNPWGNAGFQPWIYFRYAEILLNFAEAANEAYGPDAVPSGASFSARQAINMIRSRTGVNMPAVIAVGQDAMRTAIRHERQIELAFEEHRFYDVRRWKIAEVTENLPCRGVIITKNGDGSFSFASKIALDGRKFEPKHYWLPIPRAEILASGNKLDQNPLY
ncbi:Starch-binding associating with outer membrane [Pedobacter steynii]|uniref:Starch-binding associating with outer membrane n=1 Tax=Pedobacter steynii TaxID=430522 RepID=A0A1G9V2P0_9SPHI|nr:RagB/SusD family nutrient uptake outer membrane protein [Pedobacter steynii]NQX40959.1 RagB/SusD family nutrient uptake outer membrane protein [Pedobacter steynii]SDM66317.1 Starch-binding associating with outer membrane [Pedobacter steynii]